MSDAEWDADDFEPPKAATAPLVKSDKWEGEDEDDDVKDSWDKDSEDEDSKGSEESETLKAVQRKKKKKMHEIIAEKEAMKALEAEERAKALAAKEAANTPEGKLAEKLRAQKIAEIENLQIARDMLGVKSGSIDAMIPDTKEDFDLLSKAIVDKVQLFATSDKYNDFIEGLVKDLCLDQPATSLKKIKIHVEALHSTRLKEEKASKSKKPGAKGRSSVKVERDNMDFIGGGGNDGYDDMDDFM